MRVKKHQPNLLNSIKSCNSIIVDDGESICLEQSQDSAAKIYSPESVKKHKAPFSLKLNLNKPLRENKQKACNTKKVQQEDTNRYSLWLAYIAILLIASELIRCVYFGGELIAKE